MVPVEGVLIDVLRLQASKEWSTSGASGVAGNAQLVCQLRSPGGTVTVANEDLDA